MTIQATDGRVLERSLPVGLRSKPEARLRKLRQSVTLEIRFCVPDGMDLNEIKAAIGEEEIGSFGPSHLGRYRDALEVADGECAYWGDKTESNGLSKLVVEINAAHSRFKRLLQSVPTAEERIRMKESIVQDIVLDCYQHSFRLEDVPEIVYLQTFTENDEATRAAEICLNFDKALRLLEQGKTSRNRPQ